MTAVRCRAIPNPPLSILQDGIQPLAALIYAIPSNSMSHFSLSPLRPLPEGIFSPLKRRILTALSLPFAQIQRAPRNERLPVNWFKSAGPLDPRIEQPWQLWGTRGHDSYVVPQACVTCVLVDGSLHTHATAPKPLQAGQPKNIGS